MKQVRLFAMALAAVMAAGTVSMPAAQAADVSYGADLGMFSKYIWRGAEQTTGTAVQGDLSASMGGFSASAWLSNSYTNAANQTVVETDWTLDYSGSVGKVGYDVGGIWYTYLYDAPSNFPEVFASLSYDAPISPSVKVSYTTTDSKSKTYLAGDTWVDLGLSGSLPGGVGLSATYSFASWKKDAVNRPDASVWKSGSQELMLSMSKDYTIGGVTATPSLTGYIPLMGKDNAGTREIYATAATPEVVLGTNFSF